MTEPAPLFAALDAVTSTDAWCRTGDPAPIREAVLGVLGPHLVPAGHVVVPDGSDDDSDEFWRLLEAMREARRRTRPPGGAGGQTTDATMRREHWLELAMYAAMVATAKEQPEC